MENSNSISAFDLLRHRLNMPDPWIFTEATAAPKRQITPHIINRIFRRMWVVVGLGSAAATYLTKYIQQKELLKSWQL